MLMVTAKAKTLRTTSLNQGYGIDLSSENGLKNICIHGNYEVSYPTDAPMKMSFMGDLKDDGSYEIPVHCHGENILGGEELAEYVLQAAEASDYINANVNVNNILSFTSKTNKTLLPTGRLRGAENEIFTIMFKFSAPENTGGTLTTTGLVYLYNSGNQAITYSGSYDGSTVQVVRASNATRQLLNMNISTTSQKLRTIDLSTFGIFRGTVGVTDFATYWGEKKSFYLSSPLRKFGSYEDVAYPTQGYAVRNVKSLALSLRSAEAVNVGSEFPTYKVALPADIDGKDCMLDQFTKCIDQSEIAVGPFMYYTLNNSLYVSVPEEYNTPKLFLEYFNSLGVNILYNASEQIIERFTPITISTRKGRNYVDIMTETIPGTIDFTYV